MFIEFARQQTEEKGVIRSLLTSQLSAHGAAALGDGGKPSGGGGLVQVQPSSHARPDVEMQYVCVEGLGQEKIGSLLILHHF